MATAVTSEKVSSRTKNLFFDFDPDSADLADVSWQDMRDWGAFRAHFVRTVGTGAIDQMLIRASASSDGSSPVTVLAKTLTDVQPDAVGDYSGMEVTREQVLEVLASARYVSMSLEFATSTDEGVVHYLFTEPRFAYTGLTADSIA